MRKLILKSGLSPGDIVMLTAAVRDLHHGYPGRFQTDVRTACPGLWENNPHLTPLPEDDPQAEIIDCAYPLINHCNELPYHCLHGFIDFLNQRLELKITPTAFHGDIHLSRQERAWYSQVQEVTRMTIPFWIIAAGGKYDVTIKWWSAERFQAVVDHFHGRIQFVQVGEFGHHHPRLRGVIDLRGRTNLRELVRLVHHAQGVLCPVTALMHLAAAVETRRSQPPHRPCVVVAGGREPAHWEAYPHHQFIHTIGALPCCAHGGCWKDRVTPLRDGDKRDRPGNLCVDVTHGLPRCMDMISTVEVIRRIESYFVGGVVSYLTPAQIEAAARGVAATEDNSYDQQPLNLHSAGQACDQYIRTIPPYPGRYEGRGIVICGGGMKYFPSTWVCINMLRRLGCRLPIEVWYLGKEEMDAPMRALLTPLGVRCVDALAVRKRFPMRVLKGWELKSYAILHSAFREVLLLDADNVAVKNPEFLFDTPEFRKTGAMFWPDFEWFANKESRKAWRSCGLRPPPEHEFESGQILVDKERCWAALNLSLWFNENSDFYYRYVYGDKETFHLAFRKLGKSYTLIPTDIHPLEATMCQHDPKGRRLFQHRNQAKWDLFYNRRVQDFWLERECLEALNRLRDLWDGRMESQRQRGAPAISNRNRRSPLKIAAVMISCVKRDQVRKETLQNLARTDWGDLPLSIHLDPATGGNPYHQQAANSQAALQKGLETGADYILFLEDDLDFNRHLRHNLFHWPPLSRREVTLASLYNPGLRESACDVRRNARIVPPQAIFGSQAFLLSAATAEHSLRHWDKAEGGQDLRISRLAGRLKRPIFFHAPSLVQHIGRRSTWTKFFHQARDFDPHWKAAPAS